ncbi:zinc ribbon domain-containing protein [Alkalibacillus aidingensis]|uniref:zinc ribbon domain-containing protein n=1 Tax=Alkalibacillus aidingensis TaxID=2747607 RepID=UPI001661149B|nr:zinc ribbon domain-containing protein [Alkalibacillus aidingensis]
MMYCPKCGAKTKHDEAYCVVCGAQLPKDLEERTQNIDGFNRWWLAPIITFACILLLGIGLHFYLEYNNSKAIEAYETGVEYALEGQYKRAQDHFEEALTYNSNLEVASTNVDFMDIALEINDQLQDIDTLIEQGAFQQAMQITQESENRLSNYNGEIINQLLDSIIDKRNQVRLSQVKQRIEEDPPIEELKILLWQLDSVDHDEAEELREMMRNRIINYTVSEANEMLQDHQFSTAKAIVDDGLRIDPENERLTSLKTTIEKQRIDFETQQREIIEQAMSQYELEQEQNENHAVELLDVEVDVNEFDEVIVAGELKSVATVPIHSIRIQYSLFDEDEELVTENETYLFPDTLYPDEVGEFEHTHYDIPENVTINIDQITWYLENENE